MVQVFYHPALAPCAASGSVVTAGNFDGVHRGHLAVVQTARALADKAGLALVAITFDPHPRTILHPERPLVALTTLDEKIALLGAAGVDAVYVIPFSKAYAATTAENFADETLRHALGAKIVVVGYDFAFGKGRSGTTDALANLGADRGFHVVVVPPFEVGGAVCSSSRIRAALENGDIPLAESLLGRSLAKNTAEKSVNF